jgi:serine/threonine-protein kinase RsbW
VSRLKLTIDSDLGDVSLVAVAVNRVCLYLGLNRIEASQVELCTVEAVTNAIQHAYHGQPGKAVSVVLSSEIDQLQLEVIDHGTPMSQRNVERLLHGTDVFQVGPTEMASLPESGRGLQIIHDLMDAVSYSPEGSFNRLQLTRRIPRTGPKLSPG